MALAIATGAGCGAAAPPGPAALEAPAAGHALEQLAVLTVLPENPPDTYRRAAYGERWADVTGSGCNTRDQLLYAHALPGTVRTGVQGRCPHDVLGGSWTDYYTGATLTFADLKNQRQAQAITLDHLVALAEADRSGAAAWDADRKRRFANDPANLRVTAGTVNSSKGDRDPAQWTAPQRARCAYGTAYVAVKHTWQLAVDQAEHDALAAQLAGCPTPADAGD